MKDLISIAENRDCMEAMKQFPDKFFDLAIVDPPYGLDVFKSKSRIRKYGQTETTSTYAPDAEYFRELFRVSKNQIIWGGNYFELPPTRGFIFWHKHQPLTDYAAGEYAWTSFDRNAKCFDHPFYGNINAEKGRMHPHQKPVKLYKWILKNYGNGGGKILDTHLGSGSSRIAAYDMGFDFWGYEIDKDYFEAQEKRFKQHTSQLTLV